MKVLNLRYEGAWQECQASRSPDESGAVTGGHEFGHLANLRHQNSILNLMQQNAGFPGLRMFNMNATSITSEQLKKPHFL